MKNIRFVFTIGLILFLPAFITAEEPCSECPLLEEMNNAAEKKMKIEEKITNDYIKPPNNMILKECIKAINKIKLTHDFKFEFNLPTIALDAVLDNLCQIAVNEGMKHISKLAANYKFEVLNGLVSASLDGAIKVEGENTGIPTSQSQPQKKPSFEVKYKVQDNSSEVAQSIWDMIN